MQTTLFDAADSPPTQIIQLRDYQQDAIDCILEAEQRGVRKQLGVAATGLGKGLAVGTTVLKSDGSWRPVQELEVGDFVVGADGYPTKVDGVFPRGIQPCFVVTTDDGVSIVVDADHLWTVATDDGVKRDAPWDTLETQRLHKIGVVSSTGFPRWRLPVVAPITFDAQPELPVDAHTLGAVIADGTIVQHPTDVCPGPLWTADRPYRAQQGTTARSNINDALSYLGTWGLGPLDRFIPTPYLCAPIETRRLLLAGLLNDTKQDGNGTIKCFTSSAHLANDVKELAGSLGIITTITSDAPGTNVSIHKLVFGDTSRPHTVRKIVSIDAVSPRETVCIKVSAEDGLFISEGHVVTHNTIVFNSLAQRKGVRTLILAHRDELISQAVDKLLMMWPEADVGVIKAKRNEIEHQIIVGSIQTLSRQSRREQIPRDWFKLIIVDECFPAGTLVDGHPIETLVEGDVVSSFDERTGVMVPRRIVRTMSKRPSSLVRLHMANGDHLVCTPEHPMWTNDGWLSAASCEGANLSVHDMYNLRAGNSGDTKDMFEEVPLSSRGTVSAWSETKTSIQTHQGNVHGVWGHGLDPEGSAKPSESLELQGSGVLLRQVSRHMDESPFLENYERHEPQVCVEAYAGAQSDGKERSTPENGGDVASDWTSATMEGWERPRDDRTSEETSLGTWPWVDSRIYRSHGSASDQRGASDTLQDRHISSRTGDRCRGGRFKPCGYSEEGSGSPQGQVLVGPRVDRVEVLEPESDGQYGGLCPDGFVYNIEVEDTHTYTANGYVVHNCHHATADSYTSTIEYFADSDPLILGVTATPDRGDGKGLDEVFDEVVFNYDILWGIRRGFLSDIKGRRITMSGLDLSKVRISRGDYAEGDVGRALEDADAPNQIADAYVRFAPDRKTIVFTPTVSVADAVSIALRNRGVSAAMVSGETPIDERRQMLKDFTSGDIMVMVNCQVLCEGFDEPSVDCIVLARPTRSRALYTQCLDDATEILTSSGWRSRGKIMDDDVVATFDVESGAMGWSPILSRVDRELGADEAMYEIESPHQSIRVTGGHRMVCSLTGGHPHEWGEWQLIEAQDAAVIPDPWKLPVSGLQDTEGVPLSNNAIRSIGWGMSNAAVDPVFNESFSSVSEAITREQMGILLDAIHRGKGTDQDRQKSTRSSYHLSLRHNRVLADRLQSLCVRRGYRAAVTEDHGGNLIVHVRDQQTVTVGGGSVNDRPMFVHSPTNQGERVWCVETETGTLVTRRNGRVAILGNCIGRGTRRHPGKDNCLVLDVVGASEEHSLVTIPSLFGIERGDEFEHKEMTVAEAIQEQVERQVKLGELKIQEVELFRKVVDSPLAWTGYVSARGVRGYTISIGGDTNTTVILEELQRQDDSSRRVDSGDSDGADGADSSAPLSLWRVCVREKDGNDEYLKRPLMSNVDLEMAQGVGEDYVRKHGHSALVSRDAPWRKSPPSDKQLLFAKKLHIPVGEEWTKGQVSEAIDAALARRNAHRSGSYKRS